MNAQAYSDVIMPSSPALSRTKRALRRAAGRSGGVFERVPGSNKPYHFWYVKPEGQPRTPERPTRSQTPTATITSHTPTSPSTIKGPGTKEPQMAHSPGRHAAGTAMASSARKPAYTVARAAADDDDEGTDASSLASSSLSEYTIASHERRESVIHRSMGSLRERVRGSALGTSIQQLRDRRRAEHKLRRQEAQGIEAARVPAHEARAGRRERASKFFEHLGGEETEKSTVGLLRESEKATRRFFGLEQKRA